MGSIGSPASKCSPCKSQIITRSKHDINPGDRTPIKGIPIKLNERTQIKGKPIKLNFDSIDVIKIANSSIFDEIASEVNKHLVLNRNINRNRKRKQTKINNKSKKIIKVKN